MWMSDVEKILRIFEKRKDVYPLKIKEHDGFSFGEFKDDEGNAIQVKLIPGVY